MFSSRKSADWTNTNEAMAYATIVDPGSSFSDRRQSILPKTEGFYQLLKSPILKKDVSTKVSLTAISSTGRKVAVLTDNRFWVFNTSPVSFICGGEFAKRTDFKYESLNRPMTSQHPTPDKFKVKDFFSVALNDSFLAIGVPGKVMTFYLNGDHAGRWVFCDSMDHGTGVERLKFSPNGDQLLALLQYEKGQDIEITAKIYNTADFPTFQLDRRKPVPSINPIEVTWTCEHMHIPSDASFSKDGNIIAICTTRAGRHAQILLLKKFNGVWKRWKFQTVEVFQTNDHRDWHGNGLTGISLSFPTYAVLMVVLPMTSSLHCLSIHRQRNRLRLFLTVIGSLHRKTGQKSS